MAVLTEEEGRSLTSEIRGALVFAADKIIVAYHGRVWIGMGYASWDDYRETEFGGSFIRLPREERQAAVTSLRDAGLSLRAIAAATGDSKDTIGRALAGVSNETPAPDPEPAKPITGTDGKTYQRPASKPEPDDVIDAEVVQDEPEPVTSRTPKRRPITDQARDAGWELRKAVERLERIAADDRFTANTSKVAPHLRGHLTNAVEVCTDLLNRINTQLEDIA